MGTGFTPEQARGILMREGSICAMWGANPNCRRTATTANHRLNRGAGGSKMRNGTDNGCAICDTCNSDIESLAELAAEARRRGVKLRDGDNPSSIPIWISFFAQWCVLRDDALYLTGITDPTLDAHQLAGQLPETGDTAL